MRLRLPQGLLGTALAAALALAPLPAALAQDRSFLEEEVVQVFRDLEAGRLDPQLARSQCLLGVVEGEDAESLRQVMSAYLEVSRSAALPAFCNAVIDAVVAGEFRAEEFRPLINGRDKEAEAYAIGRLLRQVYITHNGLLSMPVAAPLAEDARP